jgi:hypothetical protein
MAILDGSPGVPGWVVAALLRADRKRVGRGAIPETGIAKDGSFNPTILCRLEMDVIVYFQWVAAISNRKPLSISDD